MFTKAKIIVLLLVIFIVMSPALLLAQMNDDPNYTFPVIVLTLGGALAPGLISLVTKAFKESWLRYIVALFLSAVMGFFGIVLLKIPLTISNIAIILPAFATLTNTAWKLWWHKIIKG